MIGISCKYISDTRCGPNLLTLATFYSFTHLLGLDVSGRLLRKCFIHLMSYLQLVTSSFFYFFWKMLSEHILPIYREKLWYIRKELGILWCAVWRVGRCSAPSNSHHHCHYILAEKEIQVCIKLMISCVELPCEWNENFQFKRFGKRSTLIIH